MKLKRKEYGLKFVDLYAEVVATPYLEDSEKSSIITGVIIFGMDILSEEFPRFFKPLFRIITRHFKLRHDALHILMEKTDGKA